ncbi:MAG: undecaprenyl/decaprenyl-phosphate alpha-N-acetylglucosaminyl 1-phosphate transferase [Victivallales bacterium]|nr:undecaprenyl/decaprenyl-phosphate alpha-N-acetylglucosaminyl 1-phosphate transferase [Victivallales bacterium]
MSWNILYIAAWLMAAILATVTTAICRKLAPRWGFVDKPKQEAHKSHKTATPVLGGLGMVSAWLLVIIGGLAVAKLAPSIAGGRIAPFLDGINAVLPKMLAIMLGATAFSILGMCDDKNAFSAKFKFLWQFVIAGCVAASGIRVFLFVENPVFGWCVTVMWIVTIVNVLNFLDNMDGLAGGIAAIAAFFFFFIAAVRGQHFVSMLSAVTGGVAVGFLMHNRPPAKIFMGDGGSHFLGFCLAVTGLLTTFYLPNESPTPAPVLIPLLVLSLPLFDAVAVVIIRMRLHLPIYVGDNRHISHRFVQLGLTRPQAVLLVCLLCLIQGAGATTLLWLPAYGFFLILLQTIALFSLVSIIQFCHKTE